MLQTVLYILALLAELLFLFSFAVYMIFLIYSHLKGSPYVPSKNKEIEYILSQAKLKPGKILYDLGCGDGRVIRLASSLYRVKGVGVDVNPLLLWWARFWSKRQNLTNISFKRQNLMDTDISAADYIYVFLMPELIKKLSPRLKEQAKKNCLVISHGFKIIGWEDHLVNTISHKPFPTYFYRLS